MMGRARWAFVPACVWLTGAIPCTEVQLNKIVVVSCNRGHSASASRSVDDCLLLAVFFFGAPLSLCVVCA